MKAQELRIGNIVTINNPEYHPRMLNIPLKVVGISPNVTPIDCLPTFAISLEHLNQEQNTYFESYSQLIKFIEPIPITKEILKDWCGAKDLNGMEELNEHYHFKLGQSSSLYVCTAKGYANEGMAIYLIHGISYSSFPCKYLHELQNLYFALTGEELEIKFTTK